MANTPTPRSLQQIQADLEDVFLAKAGISNLRVGDPILSEIEAAAQSDFRSSQDLFQLLNSSTIDNATGIALERWGTANGVPKIKASAATDVVTIGDSSFVKISTKMFQGAPAPIVGSVTLHVVDASLMPSTGNVYIGRGLPTYEGPLHYTAKTNVGTHWTLTLSTPTTKFHNNTETVILAQGGNRTVGPQITVRTPQANLSTAIDFKTVYTSTIPDGETEVDGVLVKAVKTGLIGNVPANAINSFATAPFTGATVNNPKPFSNGVPTETDDDYRDRIRNVVKSRQKGIALAITTSVTGITAPDENKRVLSAAYVPRFGEPSTLYIDDGTGYEEISTGVAVETLLDSALGGEEWFQTLHRPIAKAHVTSTNTAPYVLNDGDLLNVRGGDTVYTHNFAASAFVNIAGASAYEVVASINGNSTLGFQARTALSGTVVVLFAKHETNEALEVLDSTANVALAFPAGTTNYTTQLYKNDRLLSKDGFSAVLTSQPFASWNLVSGSQTLVLAVDGTPAITYTFVDQDFVNANTGFIAVGKNSLAGWVAVLNAKIPGITAAVSGGNLTLTSNAGPVAKAQVAVTGGTLVTANFFAVESVAGAAKDYTADRATGQIRLQTPLSALDRLSVGSANTRAFLESGTVGTVSLTNTTLWFAVDADATLVPNGVNKTTSVNVSVVTAHDWGHTLQLAATGTPFNNLLIGDQAVVWDPVFNSNLIGAYRNLYQNSSSNLLQIERRSGYMARYAHRSVALPPVGGAISKVLTTGGATRPTVLVSQVFGVTNACELYDPNTLLAGTAANMGTARASHTATTMPNGKVVVVGGRIGFGSGLGITSIEIYNPTNDTWSLSAHQLTTGVWDHTATVLASGLLLIAGGTTGGGACTNLAYTYDVTTDTLTAVGNMGTPRFGHRAVLVSTNNVLMAGGYTTGTVPTHACELYQPGGSSFVATGSLVNARSFFGLSLTAGNVIAVGDDVGGSAIASYELYTVGTGTWGGSGTLPGSRTMERQTSVTLQSGAVAYMNTYDPPTTANVLTYSGGFTAFAPNSVFTDTYTKYDTQVVLLSNNANSYLNHVVVVGGFQKQTNLRLNPLALYEEWDGNAHTWNNPDPSVANGLVTTAAGVSTVRTAGILQQLTVPTATNYTATSLTAVLNGLLRGATATVYHTNQFRINTNSYALQRDIALVAEDANSAGLQLSTSSAIDNLLGHIGSVESGNSQIGTPSFDSVQILGTLRAPGGASQSVLTSCGTLATITFPPIDAGYTMIGLRNPTSGGNGTSTVALTPPISRWGSNVGNFSTFFQAFNDPNATITSQLDLRSNAIQPWLPRDRVFLAAPYSLGPEDDLVVLVDNDPDKRFNVNLFRKLAPVGNTYSKSNVFKDGDAGSVSLALTFGLGYSFNDFAAYMRARAVAYSGSGTKALLFRYYSYGSAGNGVRTRFANPDAANAAVQVGVNTTDQNTIDVRVKLRGGAPRSPTVRTTTQLGFLCTAVDGGGIGSFLFLFNLAVASANRVGNATTLTLTMPAGLTGHGLVGGDTIFVKSSDVNFSTGAKILTSSTATTITYTETAPNAVGTTIGTVSKDSQGEATLLGSGTVTGDFFRITDPVGNFGSFGNETFAVTNVANGYLTTSSGEAVTFGPSTVPSWAPIQQSQSMVIFANPADNVAAIAAAVNALAGASNSKCPVTITALGNGLGVISESTPEDLDSQNAWYTLNDGLNYVATTTSPGSTAGDYTLVFKNNTTGSLATTADWQNEIVYVAPITTANVVAWLNTPTVTGLWTLCTIQPSDDGTRVQIASKTPGSEGGVQVQSGLGNTLTAAIKGSIQNEPALTPPTSSSTIAQSDSHGFRGGMWCQIQNQNGQPKEGVFLNVTALTSWSADGFVQVSGNQVFTVQMTAVDAFLQVEKQGRYIAISDTNLHPSVDFSFVNPGDYVQITAAATPTSLNQLSDANKGIFRILRATTGDYGGGTLWIESDIAVEELGECHIGVFTGNSLIPGDQLIVSTSLWGVQNQGAWTVESVGTTTATSADPYTVSTHFKVSTADRAVVPVAGVGGLGASANLVQAVEGVPATFVRRIDNMVPNQTDGTFVDVRWDLWLPTSSPSEATGAVISALDKLEFPTEFAAGIDGYAYDVGLIGEANRIVQGDPDDTTSYPGVAAGGARINVSGPLVRRIKVSLLLRLQSNSTDSEIADRVRSAVATVVNQTDVGTPVSLSKIVAAAGDVGGVITVTIVSPVYGVGFDQIPVQPNEKPLVLDLDQDISIAFTSA